MSDYTPTGNPATDAAGASTDMRAEFALIETAITSKANSTNAVLVTPNLGTPSAGVLTNCTGTAAGLTAGAVSAVAVGVISGLGTGVATALAVNVGSAGAPVVLNGAAGTPSSGTLTNCTGLPAAGVTGTAATLGANTFTGAQTVQAAATQDAIELAGRAGGTSSYKVTLSPTTLTASRTATLPNADDTLVGKATTDTLTNKRITARVGSTTSHATPTINTDNVDVYKLTAQTEAITSMTTNLSGTPTDGQVLIIQITGTAARAITWGASFEASTVALPTTTVTTAMLSVGFLWNSVTSKWRCMASV